MKPIREGSLVEQVMPAPFKGYVVKRVAEVLDEGPVIKYLVMQQVFNEDGSPKMTEEITGDAEVEKDSKGREVFIDAEKGIKKETGRMINKTVEMIPVFVEKWLTHDELKVLAPPPEQDAA